MAPKYRDAFAIYVAGAVLMELSLLWSEYQGGAFEHMHSARDLLFAAAIYSVVALSWPVVLLLGLFQYVHL